MKFGNLREIFEVLNLWYKFQCDVLEKILGKERPRSMLSCWAEFKEWDESKKMKNNHANF